MKRRSVVSAPDRVSSLSDVSLSKIRHCLDHLLHNCCAFRGRRALEILEVLVRLVTKQMKMAALK